MPTTIHCWAGCVCVCVFVRTLFSINFDTSSPTVDPTGVPSFSSPVYLQRLSDLIGPYSSTYRIVYRVLQPLLVRPR